ncbi:MAG: cobalamin-binding protein [Cytophagaceae bacterium]|nr:cobalamin-binding protein [Gemmatimonadaceae bacterium]
MKIVSLCPSLTELVFDLGKGEELVGRTKFCVHPADRVAAVESVGGTKNPKVERIIALRPDLVLLNEEENRVEDARALEAAGVRVHVSMPRTAEETAEMVRSIAAAVGAAESGEPIAADIEGRARRVRESARGRRPLRYAYLIWREPWMTVSNDTFIAELLGMAGGENVFGGAGERYPTVTLDDLARVAPHVVLLPSEPFPFGTKHVVELSAALGWDDSRFQLVDGELLSWHGSRTPRGIDYAERVITSV